jgi:hypothetical protein
MSTENAFPQFSKIIQLDQSTIFLPTGGLTKRELISAMCLQGLLPNYRTERTSEGDEALAKLAVYQADALIAELQKKGE